MQGKLPSPGDFDVWIAKEDASLQLFNNQLNHLQGDSSCRHKYNATEATSTDALRKCNALDCTNMIQYRGNCLLHGGKLLCDVVGCSNTIQGGQLCHVHAGGCRHLVAECAKVIQPDTCARYGVIHYKRGSQERCSHTGHHKARHKSKL